MHGAVLLHFNLRSSSFSSSISIFVRVCLRHVPHQLHPYASCHNIDCDNLKLVSGDDQCNYSQGHQLKQVLPSLSGLLCCFVEPLDSFVHSKSSICAWVTGIEVELFVAQVWEVPALAETSSFSWLAVF